MYLHSFYTPKILVHVLKSLNTRDTDEIFCIQRFSRRNKQNVLVKMPGSFYVECQTSVEVYNQI